VLHPPDPWEGQAGTRGYLYDARKVAHALGLIARGSSYRRTALHVRDADRKAEWNQVAGEVKRPDATGQRVFYTLSLDTDVSEA